MEKDHVERKCGFDLDMQRHLETYCALKSGSFSPGSCSTLCVRFYQGATEPYTIVNDQADGTPGHISTGADMHTIPKTGLKMFLFRWSLREEITTAKSKSYCSAGNLST